MADKNLVIANKLKAFMERNNLSANKLAPMIKINGKPISQQRLSGYLLGAKIPYEFIQAFAEIYPQDSLLIFTAAPNNRGVESTNAGQGESSDGKTPPSILGLPTRSADFWEGRWTDADQRCRELQGVISRALNACLASDSQARAIANNLKAETEAILSGASGMAVSSAKGT